MVRSLCPELSRLGKAPRWSSLKFNNHIPGKVDVLLTPFQCKYVLDPTHPAVLSKMDRRAFPQFEHHSFRMRAYPLAMLGKMTEGPVPTRGPGPFIPSALDPVPENRKQVDIHLSIATSMKNTSKLAVVRTAIARRVKHALELIIARGANRDCRGERAVVVLDEEEAKEMGPKWVLNGWMYIFHPTLELYRMPYHELVPLLRWALQSIHMHGMYLEHRWARTRTGLSSKSGI